MGLLNDLKFEVGPQITLSDLKNKVINKWSQICQALEPQGSKCRFQDAVFLLVLILQLILRVAIESIGSQKWASKFHTTKNLPSFNVLQQ